MVLEVKICGLSTDEAVAAALAGGASHVGFVFFPRSPRHVSVQQAAVLRRAARARAQAVAVTVDATDHELDAIIRTMEPDLLQLHGRESPARTALVKTRYGLPVMKALAIRHVADLESIDTYAGIADRLLFDARPPQGSHLPGGNGVAFDWRLLAGLDPELDYVLSGGLNAANIVSALSVVRPAAIDVSSGVERAPGIKDVALIETFLSTVRAARSSHAA